MSTKTNARLFSALLAAIGLLTGPLAAAPAGTPVHGIRCDAMEGSAFHIHQHLTVLDHGRSVPVPEDVGRPIGAQCLYWLHTHTPDGLIHVEAPMIRAFSLGDFFDVWGEPLRRDDVAGARPKKNERVIVWLNGSRWNGDPRTVPLTAHADVTIEVGPPYAKPHAFSDWRGQ